MGHLQVKKQKKNGSCLLQRSPALVGDASGGGTPDRPSAPQWSWRPGQASPWLPSHVTPKKEGRASHRHRLALRTWQSEDASGKNPDLNEAKQAAEQNCVARAFACGGAQKNSKWHGRSVPWLVTQGRRNMQGKASSRLHTRHFLAQLHGTARPGSAKISPRPSWRPAYKELESPALLSIRIYCKPGSSQERNANMLHIIWLLKHMRSKLSGCQKGSNRRTCSKGCSLG